jgi:hypothetical protein
MLLIISWVTLWEPVHIFLYERSPLKEKIQICEKIAGMDVIIRSMQDVPGE